ncbi:YrhB domain-containing protein [bacterium]|nr:YrhB domain-containing protein [bacterium]
MLNYNQAKVIVSNYLQEKYNDEIIIDEKHTIEQVFGWIFAINSKKYISTRNGRFRAYGNFPIIVDKFNDQMYEETIFRDLKCYTDSYNRFGTPFKFEKTLANTKEDHAEDKNCMPSSEIDDLLKDFI